MKKLTIGIFVEHYYPFISGVVTSVHSLANEMERLGHTVYIICPEVTGYRDDNPRIIRIPSLATSAFDNATIGLPSKRILKRLLEIDFDIVHSQDIYYTSATGLLLARKLNIPYVQTFHTLWHHYLEQNNVNPFFQIVSSSAMVISYPFYLGFKRSGKFLKNFITAKSLKSSSLVWQHILNMSEEADEVIVPSQHLKTEILHDRPNVHIHCVHNSVQPFTPDKRVLPKKKTGITRFVSVARFSPEKKLDLVVEAFSKLKKPSELIMIGEGPDLEKIKELANRLGCLERIQFLGHQDNSVVRTLMRECDVFVIASVNFDNQPMVIVEAVDAGLPIIYCDPNFREGITGDNSIRSKPNAKDLAKAFSKLTDIKLRVKMSKASKALAPDFSVRSTAKSILSLYLKAIEAKNGHSHIKKTA